MLLCRIKISIPVISVQLSDVAGKKYWSVPAIKNQTGHHCLYSHQCSDVSDITRAQRNYHSPDCDTKQSLIHKSGDSCWWPDRADCLVVKIPTLILRNEFLPEQCLYFAEIEIAIVPENVCLFKSIGVKPVTAKVFQSIPIHVCNIHTSAEKPVTVLLMELKYHCHCFLFINMYCLNLLSPSRSLQDPRIHQYLNQPILQQDWITKEVLVQFQPCDCFTLW